MCVAHRVRTYGFFSPAGSEMYKLRAHIDNVSHDKLLQFIQTLDKKCDKLVVYRHPKEEAEREHIHALLVGCNLSEKQVRERCSIDLSLEKSNKNYSVGSTYAKNIKISELTYPTYISYMSKGIHEPLYNKGFDEKLLEEYRIMFKQPTKVETVYQIEKITPVKKLTQFEISNQAQIRYLEIYKDDIEINWFQMYNIVKGICKDNRVCSHDNTVAYILQDIQSRLDPELQWKRLRNRI